VRKEDKCPVKEVSLQLLGINGTNWWFVVVVIFIKFVVFIQFLWFNAVPKRGYNHGDAEEKEMNGKLRR
jgi:hypothetical protein